MKVHGRANRGPVLADNGDPKVLPSYCSSDVTMESNKDFALWAKGKADLAISLHDFTGAKEFLSLAKFLVPNLDGMEQMAAVVDVHLAGQLRISGNEMDMYAVLQLDPSADDNTINEQYIKLALILNPDQNKVVGADAAFKLIGEAREILSDKGNRALHDMKRISFWTVCPSCKIAHHIPRKYENSELHCPSCKFGFVARDAGVDGECTHKWTQSYSNVGGKIGSYWSSSQNGMANGGPLNNGLANGGVSHNTNGQVQNHGRTEYPTASSAGFIHQMNKNVPADKRRDKMREEKAIQQKERRREEERRQSQKPKSSIMSKQGSKRSRGREEDDVGNQDDEDEDDHTSSEDEDNDTSSEDEDEDDDTSLEASEQQLSDPDADFYDFEADRLEESIRKGQIWATYEAHDGMPRKYCQIIRVQSGKPFRVRIKWLESYKLMQTEKWLKAGFCLSFGEFSLSRSTKQMDQILSHRVRNKCLESYKLTQTKKWLKAGFCRSFVDSLSRSTKQMDQICAFSHMIQLEEGSSLTIYPQEGQVWALYTDWMPGWSSLSKKQLRKKQHKYEMVVIATGFSEQKGLDCISLQKICGYVSIFCKINGHVKHLPSEEIFRFSHMVPAHRLKGDEAPNLPKECWELDPASYPPGNWE